MAKYHAAGSSMSVPLLSEWKNHEVRQALDEDKQLTGPPSATNTNTVSFFGTCLNGLNALSGSYIYSVYTLQFTPHTHTHVCVMESCILYIILYVFNKFLLNILSFWFWGE